jgi:DNA-binding NtrC family response regulator
VSDTHTRTAHTQNRTGLLATDAGGRLVLRRVLVRVVSGDSRGSEAVLEGGTLVIGSHPDVDLVVEDKTVSRYHAELALLADGVRVRDLKSTNGTFVGSSRIEAIVLTPAAEITVGKTRIELLPADVPAPEAPSEATRFGGLTGATSSMRKLFGVLERVAPTDVPILIEGEPGVGKSEAARAVHDASLRAQGPFAVLDVSASLPDGAVRKTFEMTSGGTVLIDRVDVVPSPLAAELVSALERVERGDLDVRVIATSRSDLRARVEAGAAPRDLYFHIASVRVVVPPLRDRLDDLPRLVRDLTEQLGYSDVSLSAADVAPLRAHDFPGNVRELARMIEQTLVQNRPSAPPPPPGASAAVTDELARAPFKEAKERLVDAFEREYVARLLERHGGNLSRAAQEADLDRNYLSRLAKKHGLR